MIYAYDDWVQLPVRDLYDTNMMQMAISAAKDMYEKGQNQVTDFYKQYGDFTSPFAKDMARYGQMMKGVTGLIDEAYKRGIDLTRSPEGRMLISRAVNSVDPGEFNAMRANAKMGYAYQDAMQKLLASGKYSPEQEAFELSRLGITPFDQFSTTRNGDNGWTMWNRTSPIESMTLQQFVHPSFANLRPHVLTRDEAISRVGAEYDPTYEYTGIVRSDMERAMRESLPGLIGDPRYQFFREQARQMLADQGINNPSEAQINEQFVRNAVTADSQMMTPLNRDRSDYWQQKNYQLQAQRIQNDRIKAEAQRARAIAAARRDNGGNGTQLDGMSLASVWYDSGLAKAMSSDGIKKDWWDINTQYDYAGDNIERVFRSFGRKFKGNSKPTGETVKSIQNEYEKQFSIDMDSKAIARIVGTPSSGNEEVSVISPRIINKLYGVDDIISNTSGYSKTHTTHSTNKIRNSINKYGASNTTITPLGVGYASLRKSGSFEVMPKVRITCTDKDGKVYRYDAYVDISLGSEATKGGSYFRNYKQTGGYNVSRTPEGKVKITGQPEKGAKSFNVYPDYNRWSGFGVWDTDVTSKMLHVPYSQLGTLPIVPGYDDEDEEYIEY